MLTAREIRQMLIAEMVVTGYRSREASTDTDDGWAGWAKLNPKTNDVLIRAELEARGKRG